LASAILVLSIISFANKLVVLTDSVILKFMPYLQCGH
jgi:hypothetical protein